MTRAVHSTSDPLMLPDYLRVTPKEVKARLKWWRDHPPSAVMAVVPEAQRDTRWQEANRQEALVRIDKMKARQANKAIRGPDRIEMALAARSQQIMSKAKFERLRREMPTPAHVKALEAAWVLDGTVYRPLTGLCPAETRADLIKKCRAPAVAGNTTRTTDDIAERITEMVRTRLPAFRACMKALAEANGVWDDRYDVLDNGRLRMTVSNRLRGLVKRGGEIKWPTL